MQKPWSIAFSNPNIRRFIQDHNLNIKDIRTQPFLGSDISWSNDGDGWEILLYPRFYYEGPTDISILNALTNILSRQEKIYEETPAKKFDDLTNDFFSKRPEIADDERELYASMIVEFDDVLCSALELNFLLENEYVDFEDTRYLVWYRAENFISHRCALEFLASMAVLKKAGGDTALFYDKIIKNKWYEMMPVLDKIDDCISKSRVLHQDVIDIFRLLLPNYDEESLLEKIDILRRNVIGARDELSLDYDVAISYASEDRSIVEEIARCLKQKKVAIFYDKYSEAELWGKDLLSHLTDVYSRRAKFCLMIVSKNYAVKQWTTVEREAAQTRAFKQNIEYILPLFLDDTQLPDIDPNKAFTHIQDHSTTDICEMLSKKLRLIWN